MSKLLKTINDGKPEDVYVPELVEAARKREPGQAFASNIRKERDFRNELWYLLADTAVETLISKHLDSVKSYFDSMHSYSYTHFEHYGWPKAKPRIEDDNLRTIWQQTREKVFAERSEYRSEIFPGLSLNVIATKPDAVRNVSVSSLFNIPIRAIQRVWKIETFFENQHSASAEYRKVNEDLHKVLQPVLEKFVAGKFGPLAHIRVKAQSREDDKTFAMLAGYGREERSTARGLFAYVALMETKGFAARGSVDVSRLQHEIISAAKLAHATPLEILDAAAEMLKKKGAIKVAENTIKEHVEAIKRGPIDRSGQLGLREKTLSLLENSEHEQSL